MEAENASKTPILETFWALADINPAKRIQAAKDLIISLRAVDDQSTESQEMSYCLKRLVRGLASSREGARQGFAMALTEVLHTFAYVSVTHVLDLMQKHLVVTGSAKSQEEKDVFFGWIFGLMAIVRSGRLQKDGVGEMDAELVVLLLKQLQSLAMKKSYLAELCWQVEKSIIEKLPVSLFKKNILPLFLPELEKEPAQWSPETLCLCLTLEDKFSFDVGAHSSVWQEGGILQADHIQRLSPILKKALYTHPRVHSVWDILVPRLVNKAAERPAGKKKRSDKSSRFALLICFWENIMDREFFTTSPTAKYLGFRLFERIFPSVECSCIPNILSEGFLRCLVNNLSSTSHNLYDSAKSALDTLVSVAQRDGDTRYAVLQQLVGEHGNRRFDNITSTQTVRTLVTGLEAKGVREYGKHIKDLFYTPPLPGDNAEVAAADGIRLWAIDQLYALAHSRYPPREEDWLMSTLGFFVLHAFYVYSDSPRFSDEAAQYATKMMRTELTRRPTPDLSVRVRELCATRFFSLLRDLSSRPSAREHKERGMDGLMSDGEFWAYRVLQLEDSLTALGLNPVEGKYNLVKKTTRARRKMKRTLGLVRAVPHGPFWRRHRAFENLLLHVSIQLRVDGELADVIAELHECWRRISPCPVPVDEEDGELEDDDDEEEEEEDDDDDAEEEDEDEENAEKGQAVRNKDAKPGEKIEAEDGDSMPDREPESMAVLVDILISLLAKPSGQLRQVVGLVFRGFTSMLTPAALRLLVDTVSSRRDETLLDPDGGEAGKKPRYRRGEDEDEVDDDEDEKEELLDDEQMMQMDAKLSEIFKLMKSQKSSDKDLRESVGHFKQRVIDLIEIYIEKESTNPLVLRLLSPLHQAIKFAVGQKQQALADRLSGVFVKLCKSKQYPKEGRINPIRLHRVLKTFFLDGMRSASIPAPISEAGIFFVIRVLLGNQPAPRQTNPTAHPKHMQQKPTQPAIVKAEGKQKQTEKGINKAAKKQTEESQPEHPDESERLTGVQWVSPEHTGELMGALDVDVVMGYLRTGIKDMVERKNSHLQSTLFAGINDRFPTLGLRLLPFVLEGVAGARSNYERSHCFIVFSSLLKQRAALGSGGEALVPHLPRIQRAFSMGLLPVRFGRGIKAKEMLPVLQCAHSVCVFFLRNAKLPCPRVRELFYDPTVTARQLSLPTLPKGEATAVVSTYPYPEPIDPCDTSRRLLNVLEELLPFHVASTKVTNVARQLFNILQVPLPLSLRPKQQTAGKKKAKNK